ncbi:hypothetical protein [Actinocorallia longicatena]|uniref:Uncharacterized protein n=1 Tax=Actinocorallia longicatena TaxID=111803 RepID=A0ABP6QL14_9ACTN
MKQGERAALAYLVAALFSAAGWAAWLGWDQEYDVRPDGGTEGPYQPWQVVGLVLTLGVVVVLSSWRLHGPGTVAGTATGLAVASFRDWSDDDSGLFIVGVMMITVGALAVSGLAALVVSAVARGTGPQARAAGASRPRAASPVRTAAEVTAALLGSIVLWFSWHLVWFDGPWATFAWEALGSVLAGTAAAALAVRAGRLAPSLSGVLAGTALTGLSLPGLLLLPAVAATALAVRKVLDRRNRAHPAGPGR